MVSPTAIVAYLALFVSIGLGFLFVNLLVGRFLRPYAPNTEKLEVYECGEPTIGSSFVQFDLRFYVVALLFIIFDVEVAFFFPWAVVFGKSTNLMDENFPVVQASASLDPGAAPMLTEPARAALREMGLPATSVTGPATDVVTLASEPATVDDAATALRETASSLAWLSIADIAVFFAVLMVGFAYVWRRGDLDWVRAVSQERSAPLPRPAPTRSDRTPAMSVLS